MLEVILQERILDFFEGGGGVLGQILQRKRYRQLIKNLAKVTLKNWPKTWVFFGACFL